MKRKYLLYFIILAGLCLLLAGCGGPQNPLRFGGAEQPFWNGLWDGMTIVITFVLELIGDRKYGIYDVHQHTVAHDFGFVVGASGFVFGGFKIFD